MVVRVLGEPVVVAMRKVTLTGAEGFRIASMNGPHYNIGSNANTRERRAVCGLPQESEDLLKLTGMKLKRRIHRNGAVNCFVCWTLPDQ